MRILEHANPAALFAGMHALFAAEEAEHNLLLGVLKAVSEGRYAPIVPLVWAVCDEGGALVGAAVRTAPSPLLVSRMPMQAIDALADQMLDQPILPCRVMGIESVMERLRTRLCMAPPSAWRGCACSRSSASCQHAARQAGCVAPHRKIRRP